MTRAQADGVACVLCGRDLAADGAPASVPVGIVDGAQTFTCTHCDHT